MYPKHFVQRIGLLVSLPYSNMSTNGTSISLFSGAAKGVTVNASGSNNSCLSCGVEGGAVVVALM